MKFKVIIFLTLLNSYQLFAIGQKDNSLIDDYLNKSESFLTINQDSALTYANKAYTLANDLKAPDKKVDALFLKVRSSIILNDYSGAYEFCGQAQNIVNENELTNKQPEVYMYLGLVYQVMGLTSEALKHFFTSVEYSDQLSESQINRRENDLYYYLGSTYSEMGDLDLSKEYLHHSIALAKARGIPEDAFNSYMLLGNLSSNLDSVNKYFNLAENTLDGSNNIHYKEVVFLGSKALLNKTIGNLKESKSNYLTAISIAKKYGYRYYLGNFYNNYAYLLMAEANYDSAKINLEQAMGLAKEIDDIDLEASIYDSYSDYFGRINDYKQAYEYQNKSIQKRNEYEQKQRVKESLFLSTVFETEKKEKEILQKENQIGRFRSILFGTVALITVLLAFLIYYRQKTLLGRARLETIEKEKSLEIADALIEGQDVERKRLAMDLHDGLGARLGSLRFMVDAFVKGNPNFDEISNSVDGISKHVRDLSHRMLPTQLEELGLVASLQNLVNSINHSSGFNVEIEAQVEERLSTKHETNLYYLTYELINNAIKHSGGNAIFIQLFRHTDSVTLSVEDNGNGYDTSLSKDGLGLKNIKQRVEYLKGELIVDSRIGEGTIFMIEVPIF
jgi:two-component system, NarL family, sensor kinase